MHFIARSQTPDYNRLYTPSLLDLRSQLSSHDAPKYTPGHALKDAPNCTRWHPPSLLDYTLPSKLSRRSQAYSRARSQIHSQLHSMTLPACLTIRSQVHSPDAPKYTPNCTRWHTPSLLDYTLPCMLLGARSRDLLSCRHQAPGGGSREAGGSGRNHDVGRYHSLNLIFSAATATRSHDASWSWC